MFKITDKLSILTYKMIGRGVSPAMTVSGQLSLDAVALHEGQQKRVKVYSSYNAAQANLRLRLTRLCDDLYLPKCIFADEKIIVEEWIHGKPLNKVRLGKHRHLEVIARFLSKTKVDSKLNDCDKGFDYYKFIASRLGRWSFISQINEALIEWQEDYEKTKSSINFGLSHNDLNITNFIVEKDTEKLYIIDNEFLAYDRSWPMNYNNSLLFVNKKYSAPDHLPVEFVERTWKIRKMGKFMSKNTLNPSDKTRNELYEFFNK